MPLSRFPWPAQEHLKQGTANIRIFATSTPGFSQYTQPHLTAHQTPASHPPTTACKMCHHYLEHRFCALGPSCTSGYGWTNASHELYLQPYAILRRTRICEQAGKRDGCAGESSYLGPGSDIKTSEMLCRFCAAGGDAVGTPPGREREDLEGGTARGGKDGGAGSGTGERRVGKGVAPLALEVDDEVDEVVGRGWQKKDTGTGGKEKGKGKGKRGVSLDRRSAGSSKDQGSEKRRREG